MSLQTIERTCYEFLKAVVEEPYVKLDEIPQQELNYYSIILKQLMKGTKPNFDLLNQKFKGGDLSPSKVG